MAREVITHSPEETRALGQEFGATLHAGDVVLLEGELGAGKTVFVKGVADACGAEAMVHSPTFALMHRYRGTPDIVHLDLYRESQAEALEDLDLDGTRHDVITLVEWPRGLTAWQDTQRVVLEHVDETTRRITLP